MNSPCSWAASTVPFGNCDCPAPFLILLRKGGCALLLHFLTPLNSKCSGAASTSSSTTRQQLQRSALPSAERHQQTQPLTLPLTFFPSALHRQVSRRALFAPALPFPIRGMQTIEKRRCLGCVFCILMHPLRFSPERKRVCMADGNDSDRCKTARRLTVLPS